MGWIDLILDFRVHMNGKIEFLDKQEFEWNTQQIGYSRWIINNAKAACREVMNRFERGELLFEHQLHVKRYQKLKSYLQEIR